MVKKRKQRTCIGCGVKAAFRRKAINGKAPHFAASHKPDCDTPDDETRVLEATEFKSVNELKNEDGLIEINLSSGAQKIIRATDKPSHDKPNLDGKTQARRTHAKSGTIGNSIWRRRLSTLLKTLFEDPSFSNSD